MCYQATSEALATRTKRFLASWALTSLATAAGTSWITTIKLILPTMNSHGTIVEHKTNSTMKTCWVRGAASTVTFMTLCNLVLPLGKCWVLALNLLGGKSSMVLHHTHQTTWCCGTTWKLAELLTQLVSTLNLSTHDQA